MTTRATIRLAYERAGRTTRALCSMLGLPRDSRSARSIYAMVWHRAAGLVNEQPDQSGLYPYVYRKLSDQPRQMTLEFA